MPDQRVDRLALLTATFVALTVLVGTGATDAIDAAILGVLVPFRTPFVTDAFQLITLLGSLAVSSIIAIALTVLFVAREGRRGQVVLFLFAGIALEAVLKQIVFQPGPPSELVRDTAVILNLRDLSPYTYPSGHAMRLTFLAAMLASRYPRVRAPLAIVVALVAFGRIYLAAGWATDVASGLLAGLALATAAELVASRIDAARPRVREGLVTP